MLVDSTAHLDNVTVRMFSGLVVDLFAGSGALGIEALSRGAAHCTFVENDRNALDALHENLETLGFDDQATVISADATSDLAVAQSADLVLADPPYRFDEWESVLANIGAPVVVIESDRVIPLPSGWTTYREKHYGSTVVVIASAPNSTKDRSS
jgi:16S rRNA (guanine966-N2)-methyltransferase